MQAEDKTTPHKEETQLVHARSRQLFLHKEQTVTQLRSRLLENSNFGSRSLCCLCWKDEESLLSNDRLRNERILGTKRFPPKQSRSLKAFKSTRKNFPCLIFTLTGGALPTPKQASPPKSPEKKKRTCRKKWVPYPLNADSPICK